MSCMSLIEESAIDKRNAGCGAFVGCRLYIWGGMSLLSNRHGRSQIPKLGLPGEVNIPRLQFIKIIFNSMGEHNIIINVEIFSSRVAAVPRLTMQNLEMGTCQASCPISTSWCSACNGPCSL